jgi:serine/threonine protein phosphatase PrpC
MGNTLDNPITEKESDFYQSAATGLAAGATGMQGWRLEMEDAHVAIDIPDAPGHMFLAVFDGHAGAGAAKYAAREIIGHLKATEEWVRYVAGGYSDPHLLGEAMSVAFVNLDQYMRAHQETTNGQDSSGCTSVTAVITPTHIVCANAGDSRCVMGTNSTTKELSFDHKPYNQMEKERIEKAGGFVQWNRVDGDLAVSRALGDFGYKSATLEPKHQKVSPHPDIEVHERTPEDDVLILACDGLWDVMASNEAVNTAREIFRSGESNPLLVAEEMIDLALDKGSKDNISCIIVTLPGASIGTGEGVTGRRRARHNAHRGDRYPGSPESNNALQYDGSPSSPSSKDDH